MEQATPIVEFREVTKRTLANDRVSLKIYPGEVFALVGENGAGKSTLMNLLYGMKEPTSGEILIKGEPIRAGFNPEAAMSRGISMVHQHFKLVPSFTVAQNIFLGHELKKGLFVDRAAQVKAVEELSARYGLKVEADVPVRELSVGLQQRVEILKALRTGADVLILDEPTAVLTPQETQELFEVIRRIVKDMNMTVILITHKLPEVMAISHRVGVMRRGRLEAVLNTRDTNEKQIASLMVGREVIFDDLRRDQAPGEERIRVQGLQVLSDRGLPAVKGLDLQVHAGEIIGICGVEGNGQTELAECIAGMRSPKAGRVEICGQEVTGKPPRAVREAGLSYIPEDRMSMGMDSKATIGENLLLGKHRQKPFALGKGLYLSRRAVRRHAQDLAGEYDIRLSSVDSLAGDLSGGNMQKVVIAREFSFNSPALLICQPTRGVDIGATEFIHESIIEKRNQGCAVLLISADLDELFRLSDQLYTLYEGEITGRFPAGTITQEEISYYMTGGRQEKQQEESKP